MKNLLVLLTLLTFSITCFSQTKEMSAEECKTKLDSINSNCNYKKGIKERLKICQANPNNDESLKSLYFLRNCIDKKDLHETYSKLNEENKSNTYAKALDLFINTPQIKKGDTIFDFEAKTSNNENFILSDIVREKDVLLIFGGLGCMGEKSRQELREIYAKLDLSKVEVVSFFKLENEKDLINSIKKYNVTWLAISDFKGILSEPWLAYVDKGTPTTVFIDSDGKILVKRPGLINKALKLLKRHIKN